MVSPTTWDFGSFEVGQTSAAREIQIGPAAGNQTDVVNAVTTSCPDFTVATPDLPAEVTRACAEGQAAPCTTSEYRSYSFSAQFTPTIEGPVSCVVTITTNTTTTRTITLSGTGTSPALRIAVAPAAVEFGDIRRTETSSAVPVAVRNVGSQPLTVSSVTATAGFSVGVVPADMVIAPKSSQTYSVTCTPPDVGAVSGELVISSNDPLQPTVTIPLACQGIDSVLGVTPSPLTMPPTRVGESVEASLEVRNTSLTDVTLGALTLAGPDLTLVNPPAGGTVLAAGAILSITVRHVPADAGTTEGTLSIPHDGGQLRTTQISGRALATSMALTPDGDVDLGPVCIGQTKRQPFRVVANAEGGFTVVAIEPPVEPFALVAPALPATIQGAGASSFVFDVSVAPTEPGPVSSPMTVISNIPNAARREVRLSAVALAAGVSPYPDRLDLGSQPLDTTTIGQPVNLVNCAATATGFGTARIEGPDAASFAIVSQPMTSTIAPNGLATWLVVMTVRDPGPKTASFVVTHDGGAAVVALEGEGLTPAVLGEDGPASYYDCSTGGRDLPWPLGIAVLFALRRRRR